MPPDDALRDKTALVTGAAQRLGQEIARTLAAAGTHVVLHCRRSHNQAEQLARELRDYGVNAWVFAADLGDTAALASFFDGVCRATGGVDFLVNNASIFQEDGLRDFTPEALDANMRINALAPALLARQFAAQARPGCIVNLLDTMICDYDKKHVAYHVSKRALDALTRMMAVEFAPLIRVNAVAPGLVLAPVGAPSDYLERLTHTNPLQRYGEARDVADAVLFLLRNSFITGQTIFVDGGRHLRGSMYA